jgi:hypothetical protein
MLLVRSRRLHDVLNPNNSCPASRRRRLVLRNLLVGLSVREDVFFVHLLVRGSFRSLSSSSSLEDSCSRVEEIRIEMRQPLDPSTLL